MGTMLDTFFFRSGVTRYTIFFQRWQKKFAHFFLEKPPKNPYRGGSVTISCKFGICSLWTFPFSKPVQRCVPTAVSCITCAEAALPERKRPYLSATGTLLSWGEQCLPTDMLSNIAQLWADGREKQSQLSLYFLFFFFLFFFFSSFFLFLFLAHWKPYGDALGR